MSGSGGDKVCLVVGVGPGNGEAMARAFAAEGYRVALMARDVERIRPLADELSGLAVAGDVTDNARLAAALEEVTKALGPVHTLVWNVGNAVFGTIDEIDTDAMELGFRTNTLGLFVAAKALVPGMREAGGGNILITGATASLRGKPFTTAFAAGKAAQRSLAQSLARQLGPDGIHVALVIVDGMVDGPRLRARTPSPEAGTILDPAAIADALVFLARQPPSAWTFELDVRPSKESW